MVRIPRVLLTALMLAACDGPLSAADDAPPAGNWKFSFLNANQGRMIAPWLLKLQQKDNKWTGEVLASAQGAQGVTLDDVKVMGDQLSFNLVLQGTKLSFEGKVPQAKDKKILGSLLLGIALVPAEMDPTKQITIDPYEDAKEIVAKREAGPELFQAALLLIRQAAEKKPAAEEVRSWANKAFTGAETYGTRWQREMAVQIAQSLMQEPAYSALALEYARKARRLIDATETVQGQIHVLSVLGASLEKAGKKDEAKEIEKEADTLYLKKMPPFQPEKYAGKPKAGQRRVLVELFTGAQCPPCVAADMAFDGLTKTYSPTEAVLLQYHVHIPGPDPLTNESTLARMKYYEDEVEGTPAILFNGKLKSKASGGGFLADSKEKYQDYRDVINALLEQASPVKLTLEATRKGDKIEIRATAADVPAPGEKVRLRVVVVEEAVRYTGVNQVRFHHHIVRDLPGGPEGLALKGKTGTQELTVDVGKLRERLGNYLADFTKKEKARFPSDPQLLDLKNLYVVAFVQNDENKEVLQAAQVKVAAGND